MNQPVAWPNCATPPRRLATTLRRNSLVPPIALLLIQGLEDPSCLD